MSPTRGIHVRSTQIRAVKQYTLDIFTGVPMAAEIDMARLRLKTLILRLARFGVCLADLPAAPRMHLCTARSDALSALVIKFFGRGRRHSI